MIPSDFTATSWPAITALLASLEAHNVLFKIAAGYIRARQDATYFLRGYAWHPILAHVFEFLLWLSEPEHPCIVTGAAGCVLVNWPPAACEPVFRAI